MNNLEQEIAELQKMIETKRDQLEKEGGIIEEKELVKQSVQEIFRAGKTVPPSPTSTSSLGQTAHPTLVETAKNGSYLDHLDTDTAEAVNKLIALIPEKGIATAIELVSTNEPFVIDAFHDALIDKLYDELRARGIVK